MKHGAHWIRIAVCVVVSAALAHRGWSQKMTSANVWTVSEANVARRDFFGLVAMSEDGEVMRAIHSDERLTNLATVREQALQRALADCHDVACINQAFRWSDQDIATVASELQSLYAENRSVKAFTEGTLRGSGRLVLHDREQGGALLGSMWRDEAENMNRIVAVYGDGTPPHYAHIDAMRFDAKSPFFLEELHGLAALVAGEENSNRAFFFAPMKYAVMLLAINDRLDAGRYEPLETKENGPAVQRAAKIEWSRYPYTVIVVPGEGPEQAGIELSPLGRVRVEQAMELLRAGKAPFVLVTGGSVHPMLTPFDEAMEMRKELMEQWGVPASQILVDPYARHTTTNLRNAAREVIRYKMPLNKPMLIASDAAQIGMIVNPAFTTRCMTEMHLLPWVTLKPISATEVEMLPSRDSLEEDAADPMDP